MKAAERMAFYAGRFPLVEMATTHWFPPTPEVTRQWAERTPGGFRMNIRAWSLLTGHPTVPTSLWPDLREAVPPELRDKRNLYDRHLSEEVLDEAWQRFRHALAPLHQAGRLGAVLLQYPEWFGPKEAHREVLLAAAARLPDYPLCIELRNPKWLTGDECEDTLSFLEDNGLAFVTSDESRSGERAMPAVVATTAELAVVRFHGRAAAGWPSRYRYHDAELAEWVPRVRELAAGASEVHLLFNTCYQDFAVRAAERLSQLLR